MDSIQQFVTYLKEYKKGEIQQSMRHACSGLNNVARNRQGNEKRALDAFAMQYMDAVFASLPVETDFDTFRDRVAEFQREQNESTETWNPSDVISLTGFLKQELLRYLPHFTTEIEVTLEIVTKVDRLIEDLQSFLLSRPENGHPHKLQNRFNEDQQYRDFFDHAHDLAHVVFEDGTILYVNNAWQKVLGYSKEEIQGKSIYDFVSPDHVELLKSHRQKVLSGDSYEKEVTLGMLTKKGKLVILEGFITAKFSTEKIGFTRGIFRDITEKVENEKKLQLSNASLKEREENLYRLVNFAPDAIIAIDADSYITFWNPKATQIFGWTSEEVLGKQLSDIIIPKVHRQSHASGMKRYLSTGIAHVLNRTVEVTALNKQGEEFYISLTISNFNTEGAVGFVSFIRDITEQKRNVLELEEKRKELEKSNKELEEYAWLTSHDLREPLRKILTFSDIIVTQYESELPEKVLLYARKITDSGRRMGALINALLSYARLSHEHPSFEESDLNSIVQDVLKDLELLSEETGASFQIGELPVIDAIPLQMHQLFQNLISNSLKYSSEGVNPVVRVSSITNDNWTELIVSDNSKGFLIKDEAQIFRLFERIDPDGEGMGIGLALCKKIVEKHRGHINVKSNPGSGTTFIIGLPVLQNLKSNSRT